MSAQVPPDPGIGRIEYYHRPAYSERVDWPRISEPYTAPTLPAPDQAQVLIRQSAEQLYHRRAKMLAHQEQTVREAG